MRTADGFEMQFGTNHLGHFALTANSCRWCRQAREGGSSTCRSRGHQFAPADLDDPNFTDRDY